MDDSAAWLAFKDQLQIHYQALEAYHKELGGTYEDSSASLMDVLQAALQASLEATKAECDRVRQDCESMLRDMTRMRQAMGETSKVTGTDDPFSSFDARSRIKTPLLDSQKVLRIEHTAARKAFQERADKVIELHARLQSYLQVIPADTIAISISQNVDSDDPPTDVSLARLGQLDAAVAQCKQEIGRRRKQVQAYGREIVQLWAELAIQSDEINSSLDRAILLDAQDDPDSLGLMDKDIDALAQKKELLLEEKIRRQGIIDGQLTSIRALYRKLKLSDADLKFFCSRVRGVGEPAIRLCREELERLTELKKDHIEDFIQDARKSLEELWAALYYDENDRLEFTPAFTDTYTDAALCAHENEIVNLEARVKELEPLLALIAKHMELDQERKNLEVQVSDPARFSKRGYNPMAESKLRARIENTMPRIEQTLREALAKYEEDHGVPFRVWGEVYLDAAPEVRKPISRHEAVPPRASLAKSQTERSKANEQPAKPRSRTDVAPGRPASATPLRASNILTRSIGTSRASSTSPTKRSVSNQDKSARPPSVLRERANSNTSRLPTTGKTIVKSVVPRKNTQEPASAKTTHSVSQVMPPRVLRPAVVAKGREVSGSSTSSQVSTENWDAFQRESSEDEEEADDRSTSGAERRFGIYDRAKTTELLQRHIFNPSASTHSRDGLVESPLQHVIEEGSFVDDWDGEGF